MNATRLFALVLGLAQVVCVVSASAHPLPSSIVTYSVDADSIDLTVTIPLHELALALPAVRVLGKAPAEGPVAANLTPQLATYFDDHVALLAVDQSRLALGMASAKITGATHEDIGPYSLLVVDLSAPLLPGQNAFPPTLTYDAVMHEVRNHRAEVFLQRSGQHPQAIGVIRFDPDLGASAPLALPLP